VLRYVLPSLKKVFQFFLNTRKNKLTKNFIQEPSIREPRWPGSFYLGSFLKGSFLKYTHIKVWINLCSKVEGMVWINLFKGWKKIVS